MRTRNCRRRCSLRIGLTEECALRAHSSHAPLLASQSEVRAIRIARLVNKSLDYGAAMKRILIAIAVAFTIVALTIQPMTSKAQSQLGQPQVGKTFSIEYREPRYLGIYQRVKARKV